MKSIIHVNQAHIKFNAKEENCIKKPVFTIKQAGKTKYAREVIINGPSKIVYTPEKPLSCGAKAYIITEADLILVDETSFQEL